MEDKRIKTVRHGKEILIDPQVLKWRKRRKKSWNPPERFGRRKKAMPSGSIKKKFDNIL